MNPRNQDIPLTDEDRERLSIIRRAIAAGTYKISADNLAAKIIFSMLECCDASSSETELEGQPPDQKRG